MTMDAPAAKPRLYQSASSGECAAARKLLAYKGVEAEEVELGEQERQALLAMAGRAEVPALALSPGEVAVGLAAIAGRLEALFPEPTIFPPGLGGLHRVLAACFAQGLACQLEDLDEALAERAFLLDRIGFADFVLYGQLYRLKLSGAAKLFEELKSLSAFFFRMDRLSSSLADATG